MVKDNNLSAEDLNQGGQSPEKLDVGSDKKNQEVDLPAVIEKKDIDTALENNETVVDDDIDDFSLLAAEVSKEVADEVLKRVDESEKQPAPKKIIDSVPEGLDVYEEGESKLDDFLMDIGITRKQFFIFVGIILFFIIGVIISFMFLVSLFSEDPENIDFKDDTPPKQIEVVEEPKDEGPGLWESLKNLFASEGGEVVDVPEDKPVEKPDVVNTVDVVNDIGKTRVETIRYDSIEVLNVIGQAETSDNRLSEYIRVYRELRTVFNTDLYAYLSVVQDRESAFDEYLLKLKGTFQKFQFAKSDLEVEIAELKLRNEVTEKSLEDIQALFFAEVEALNSEAVPNLLTSFQEAARKNVIVTSELKARQAILDRYNNADGVVVDKITAIELNKDAFVKNVQVIDYKNIDLDLVVNQDS